MRLLVAARRFVRWHIAEYVIHGMPEFVTAFTVQGGADIPDIITLVAIGRERYFFTTQFEVAQVDTGGEDIHLAAGIIDVVLTLDCIANRLQQISNGCAIGGTAAVSDMQWPGGVGRDKLYLDVLSGAVSTEAETAALFKNIADDAVPGIRSQVEVDEARSGDFDFFNAVAGFDDAGDLLRQVARFTACRFRQGHCQVAGEIPVRTVTGPLDPDVRTDLRWQITAILQFGDGVCEYLYE